MSHLESLRAKLTGFQALPRFSLAIRFLFTLGSLVAQRVKRLPAMQETRFDPRVGKIPWRRKWHPTPVLFPRKLHGWRSLVGYRLWGPKELDTAERLHFLSWLIYLRPLMGPSSAQIGSNPIPGPVWFSNQAHSDPGPQFLSWTPSHFGPLPSCIAMDFGLGERTEPAELKGWRLETDSAHRESCTCHQRFPTWRLGKHSKEARNTDQAVSSSQHGCPGTDRV